MSSSQPVSVGFEEEGSLYISIILSSMLYGIYIVCYFTSLIFLITKRNISYFQQWFYIVYSSVVFAATTATFMGLTYIGQAIWILNREFPGGPLAYLIVYQEFPIATSTNVVQSAVVVLADALLIYRCFIIYERQVWVIVLPIMFLCGFISTFIAIQYFLVSDRSGHSTAFWGKMAATNYAMTLCINTLVAALIIMRLLLHRYKFRKILAADAINLYTGIVAVIVESAVPICVFGALSSATSMVNSPTQYFFSTLWSVICGLSPQLLILRVTMGIAWNRRTVAELKTETALSF